MKFKIVFSHASSWVLDAEHSAASRVHHRMWVTIWAVVLIAESDRDKLFDERKVPHWLEELKENLPISQVEGKSLVIVFLFQFNFIILFTI